ncbi:hypothetical protein [Pseudoroseomonas cervicalis]|uniref:hypothetical protein n=1 Tax=Teichococcus cervicalis TaxID=204525 RepID=UPI0022F15987|nr:hypothetical protein [Pseudoroseomonas cervicalis]WBV42761.1 hypothetical protein PFY06_16175 [Pseudoroseomonas cervicalis]
MAIASFPVIAVRIEPNADGTHILWRVSASDGTQASGFARTPGDAMRDAAAFADAMSQPRHSGGLWGKPGLRVVNKTAGGADDAG